MEQCFNLCFDQNLQSVHFIGTCILWQMSSNVLLWSYDLQVKALVLVFDPCLIIFRASWKSSKATMTCPDPSGRVGAKCPIP